LILNDPYEGGTHLPDFYIVKPVWLEDALIGWAATIGHQLDVGGVTPGGNGCDATEIFQEGLCIPPLAIRELRRTPGGLHGCPAREAGYDDSVHLNHLNGSEH
jgi:N-methylhydantoinase B/oxoprolinase/acetone carboxylase alpha subunit